MVTIRDTNFFILDLDNNHLNICEPNLNDFPITLRKGKRIVPSFFSLNFISSKHISLQHQSFIVTIDSFHVPTLVQEALKDEN